MDLSKSFEYFDPTAINDRCHIIGCGSVGSTIAENLARLGVKDFVLYDFDIVEPHNIANQMFVNSDIKKLKVEATKRIIVDINPDAESTIELHPEGYKGQKLGGFVFLAVDNIDLRREICTKNKMNRAIKVMFDVRTGLEQATTYAAVWGDLRQVNNFLKSMEYTHEEAQAAAPVTACGRTLGVAPTVKVVSTICVCNFVNFIRKGNLKPIVVCEPFGMEMY
ncbi:MAG: ThiF family adenylyltransferase [Clostridia bacterium]|nr:ThiF family adenylyltransferase [Clostridia bacterium]